MKEIPSVVKFPDLADVHNITLTACCSEALRISDLCFSSEVLPDILKSNYGKEFSEELVEELLKYIDSENYITLMPYGKYKIVKVTHDSLETFLKQALAGYEELRNEVTTLVINLHPTNSKSLSENVSQNQFIIKHILETLESDGLIELSRDSSIYSVVKIKLKII